MIAAMKRAAVALLLHGWGERAAHDGHIRRGRSRHLGKEHAEHRDHLRQPAANMTDQCERQVGDALPTTLAELISSPTRRKNGNGEQRLVVHAVEYLLQDRGERDVGEPRADEHAGHERERHRHAEVAEAEEAGRHYREDDRRAHGVPPRHLESTGRFLGLGLVVLEAVAQPVHDLLDGEKRDQRAGHRDRRVKRRDRRVRRQAKAAEPAHEVEVAEIDHAKRHREDDEPDDDFGGDAQPPVQRLGDRGEVQVVVAPRGRGEPEEDPVDEERRGHFLQPQPGMADGARHDVQADRDARSRTAPARRRPSGPARGRRARAT